MAESESTGAPPAGLVMGDVYDVIEWLGDRVSLRPPFQIHRFPAGRSNLTFRITDADSQSVVLRRPPISGVLSTAHDVAREARILRALNLSRVRVPGVIAISEETEILGAPFYVMEFVDGVAIQTPEDSTRLLSEEKRYELGLATADVLSTIHSVDVDSLGLGALGPRHDYLGRQLRRWQRQWKASHVHDLPLVERLHDVLLERKPTQQHAALLHGDFRIDNLLVNQDPTILAVLDWELAALGDPLADLGLSLAYWTEPEDPTGVWRAPSGVKGYPTRNEFVARYFRETELLPEDLNVYMAFGHWKIACIIEGVYARYLAGAMGSAPVDLELIERQPALRAQLAADLL